MPDEVCVALKTADARKLLDHLSARWADFVDTTWIQSRWAYLVSVALNEVLNGPAEPMDTDDAGNEIDLAPPCGSSWVGTHGKRLMLFGRRTPSLTTDDVGFLLGLPIEDLAAQAYATQELD